jgi:hypothetical protein
MAQFEDFIKKLEAITDIVEYRNQLDELSKSELYQYCKVKQLKNYSSLNKTKLINRLIEARIPRKSNSFHTLNFNEMVGIKDTLPKE